MKCPSYFKIIFLIQICLVSALHAFAQDEKVDSLSFLNRDTLFKELLIKELFISRKDTFFTKTDTLIIVKDLVIREKDTLVQFLRPILKDGRIEFIESKEIIPKIDTVIVHQDTLRTKNEQVLKDIQQFSQKKNFFSQLIKNFLVFETKTENQEKPESREKSDERYDSYENKVIRKIDIRVLGVFGPSVDNPDKKPRGFLEKSGNALHIKSQKWMIKRRLLFTKGDKVNSLALSETERLLRATSYAYDAKIVIVDYEGLDSVDVVVLVQDVWNISVGGGFDQKTGSKGFYIQDANFAGLGQQLLTDFTFNSRYPKGMNFYGNYNVNTFQKGLINANFTYRYAFGLSSFIAGINREFQTPEIKWLGGVNYSILEFWPYNMPFDSFRVDQKIKLSVEDVWAGYAFPVLQKKEGEEGSRLILAVRALSCLYGNVPEKKAGRSFTYYSSDNVFAGLTYINRRFFKDRYIFRLGRTEDIPIGKMIGVTTGIKKRDGPLLPYSGINFTVADFLPKFGYVSVTTGYGSFWRKGKMEEGVYYGRLLHFTPLINFKNWKYRNYISFRYTQGLNQLDGYYVNINKENGLRGFISDGLVGTKKFVVNIESNFYPPLNLLGFKMAFVLFADIAWIGLNGSLITKSNYYSGFGLGLRFRNEHLVFSMVQVMVGYYPDAVRLNKTPLQFYERSRFFYNFLDFNYSRPGQEPYL
ncbi:hypothetical protein [Sporocytophaga myxococcoides]|uniref:hypothetical protein n=1 Tax=Sporocytophaga myxococcoides TaxID=153721 RepID=UPI0012E088D3|nr:hypothetical protein [Sporocytophaga myxococcoides]